MCGRAGPHLLAQAALACRVVERTFAKVKVPSRDPDLSHTAHTIIAVHTRAHSTRPGIKARDHRSPRRMIRVSSKHSSVRCTAHTHKHKENRISSRVLHRQYHAAPTPCTKETKQTPPQTHAQQERQEQTTLRQPQSKTWVLRWVPRLVIFEWPSH